ncbi:hypothetical protein [Mycobacterium sp. SP-6446]|uniref:hypothetical protein n=1 Tax=Mycobacterium sp. SP-6446 TaxID=1834162 RepID=UPI00096F63BA|nr:hypothetical protein [Mycobacterium sp. SP-6446]OMC14957.1 hypothetical protein A5736_20465 [Mycobacterium sp. SP-6446]
MGSGGLRVVPPELQAMAAQWQGLSAGFTNTAPPSPGQPFQPTTAAISAIDAAIGVSAAACAARIQDTAAGVAAAASGYTGQDAAGQSQLGGVAPPVVMV